MGGVFMRVLFLVLLAAGLMACGDSGGFEGAEPDGQDPTDVSDGGAADVAADLDGALSDDGDPVDGATDGDAAVEVVDPTDLGAELPVDGAIDSLVPDTATPAECGSAKGVPPAGLLELKHDDGGGSTSFNEQWAGVALIAGQLASSPERLTGTHGTPVLPKAPCASACLDDDAFVRLRRAVCSLLKKCSGMHRAGLSRRIEAPERRRYGLSPTRFEFHRGNEESARKDQRGAGLAFSTGG